jgi:hypothetical protein
LVRDGSEQKYGSKNSLRANEKRGHFRRRWYSSGDSFSSQPGQTDTVSLLNLACTSGKHGEAHLNRVIYEAVSGVKILIYGSKKGLVFTVL